MEIFKGELSLNDILHNIPYKLLNSIHEARRERLSAERKKMEEEAKNAQSAGIRNQIMQR